jgi:hypothetical protein
MSKINNIDLRDVLCLKDNDTWNGIYRKVKDSGLRYRRYFEDYLGNIQYINNINHSLIKKSCFS